MACWGWVIVTSTPDGGRAVKLARPLPVMSRLQFGNVAGAPPGQLPPQSYFVMTRPAPDPLGTLTQASTENDPVGHSASASAMLITASVPFNANAAPCRPGMYAGWPTAVPLYRPRSSFIVMSPRQRAASPAGVGAQVAALPSPDVACASTGSARSATRPQAARPTSSTRAPNPETHMCAMGGQ